MRLNICAATSLVAFVMAAAIACSAESAPPTGLSGFHQPRTVHLAPDGRLMVTDLGTGHNDGRVVAVDLSTGRQQVLLGRLPSTRKSGQRYADLAGPSGAAMAPDGTVCAVIGDANQPNRGFDALRCTNGLSFDFKKFEQEHNPDGREISTNPYDIVSDGANGWYVSDAAANAVLHIDGSGRPDVVATYATFCCLSGAGAEGVPTGLSITVTARDDRLIAVALFGGAVALVPAGEATGGLDLAALPGAIAVFDDGKDGYFLTHDSGDGSRDSGRIVDRLKAEVAGGLDRPTGFVRLPDGRFVVAEQERGRVRMVEPGPPARPQ